MTKQSSIDTKETTQKLAKRARIPDLVPGLALTIGIAAVAMAVSKFTGITAFSPLFVAVILGMILRNSVGQIARTEPGIALSLRQILRSAIVLLGFQLTFTQILAVGAPAIGMIIFTLVSTFVFTKWAGRVIGVDHKLTELIAAGTSVCGASAVITTNVITRGSQEDVAYSIACVTVFGSISMFLFPVIGAGIGLSPNSYGLWVGSSIHEVAQVVAAAFQGGEVAGQTGTVAKLGRVILLAPLVLTLSAISSFRNKSAPGSAPIPWFVIGFIGVVLLNSILDLPTALHNILTGLNQFLLTVALAAMGLQTDIKKLRNKGVKPLTLGALAWLFISATGLGLAMLIYEA